MWTMAKRTETGITTEKGVNRRKAMLVAGGAVATAGALMAAPFRDELRTAGRKAIASTGEGLGYFMSRGITPRFTTWCPEPTTPLGRDNPDGAPLEYHIRLLEAYRGALERHLARGTSGAVTRPTV